MGSQVIAVCECGVNTKIAIGTGRLCHKKINYFPGFCKSCKKVVRINLKDELPICGTCEKNIAIPYNNSHLIGSIGKEVIDGSCENILTNGTYYCPKCDNMSLRFLRGHFYWD
ncbi:hypothetical protein [Winogradskyella sediminis]|uniref:hypothetical protein n=1 Tax=Winogradskyella sediminis TaxID=1382466 RepID=UPI003AA8FAA3